MWRIAQTLFIVVVSLCMWLSAYAQTNFCPPNLDFEHGNLGVWEFSTGKCCPINTPNLTGAVNGRHVLTSGAGNDFYGNFPVVVPGGGNFSLKLGNDSTGAQAEKAVYYVQVPPGPNKYILIYRYAVVFQDPPEHDENERPRFEVRAFDSLTNATIACNHHYYVPTANLPGFTKSPIGFNVYYKPWTAATLDLSDYNGKTVGIEFASGDCILGAHFGYGYVDMNCGFFEIQSTVCNTAKDVVLKGPPGFKDYKWMDAMFTAVLGTSQDITIPTPPAPTYFAVVVTPYNGFGCDDTFYTKYYVVKDTLEVTAPPKSFCQDGAVLLNASTNNKNGPFLYNWWPVSDLVCPTCPGTMVSPSASTSYFVSIENKYGCRDTAEVHVTVHPRPDADAGDDTLVCRGSTIRLNGSGGSNYMWFPAAGLDDPKAAAPYASVSGSIKYMLIVMSNEGCRDTDYVNINTYPAVSVFAGNDTAVCPGAELLLNGSGNGVLRWYPATGLSDPGIKNPAVKIIKDVQYYLEATDTYGCRDTDMIAIALIPHPVFNAGADSVICKGDTVKLYASGGESYYWHSDYAISGKTTPSPLVWPVQSHDYTVTITDTLCNRSDTLEVKVDVNPTGQLRVVATPIVCGGELTGQLTAYGGKGYQWIPSDFLSDPNGGVTKAQPPSSTLYTVTAINGYGCPDTGSAMLEVFGDAGIFTPNAFTPNGDGLNDCYRVIVTGNINSFEMYIYNRWGQAVFHTRNYSDCWDGKLMGEPAEAGTYYYFYKAASPLCGEIFNKGDILLIK